MRRFSTKIAFAPALVAALSLSALDAAPAFARHHYHSRAHYRWCRHSSGTTGLIAGGAGGALLGHALIGGPWASRPVPWAARWVAGPSIAR